MIKKVFKRDMGGAKMWLATNLLSYPKQPWDEMGKKVFVGKNLILFWDNHCCDF
jgi:hypothetical protein